MESEIKTETNNESKTRALAEAEQDYFLLCTEAVLELDEICASGASNEQIEMNAASRLKDFIKKISFIGKDVVVDAVMYFVLGDDDRYRVHKENRPIVGKATGIRFDPGLVAGELSSSLRLQLVVEDRFSIRRLVPLALPHDVVAL